MIIEHRHPLNLEPTPEQLNFIAGKVAATVEAMLFKEGFFLETETPHNTPGLRLLLEYQPPNTAYHPEAGIEEALRGR